MKIGIVGFCNLSIMQYLYKYTNILDRERTDYDVIFWNRMGVEEETGFQGKAIVYETPLNTYQPFHKKINAFFAYTHFVRKVIKQKKYDKLIVLTTQTAVALADVLLKDYRGKYIYDYRDITKEKKSAIYAKLVRKLIACSAITMMSSKGFLKELDITNNDKIVMAHNTHREGNGRIWETHISDKEPIRISFWGMVRPLSLNKKLCDYFGNDERFALNYHGIGQCQTLEKYCRENKYQNISFTGRYTLTDVEQFASQTDILHCIYKNDMTMRSAMPVKAYDAIEFRLPMLISRESYLSVFMQDTVGCFALDVEKDRQLADAVYNWYRNLNADSVETAYARLEEQIKLDDAAFARKCIQFCCT